MKKLIIFIVILAALYVIFWQDKEQVSFVRYTTREIPLTFEYDKEVYVIIENPSRITLMLKEDYKSIQRGERAGGEGPPVIVIERFDNPNHLSPLVWVETYPQFSNYNLLMGEVKERVVSGFAGIEYQADGLYPNRNVAFTNNSSIFYINGSYLEESSRLYTDFDKIIDSIELK